MPSAHQGLGLSRQQKRLFIMNDQEYTWLISAMINWLNNTPHQTQKNPKK
jgi:hypothetical protein